MERIAGGDGDGLEELEAELEAAADAGAGDNGSEPPGLRDRDPPRARVPVASA